LCMSTTRSRNSKEHGFGIDPPSRIRINAARFNYPSLLGNPDSIQPKSALNLRIAWQNVSSLVPEMSFNLRLPAPGSDWLAPVEPRFSAHAFYY